MIWFGFWHYCNNKLIDFQIYESRNNGISILFRDGEETIKEQLKVSGAEGCQKTVSCHYNPSTLLAFLKIQTLLHLRKIEKLKKKIESSCFSAPQQEVWLKNRPRMGADWFRFLTIHLFVKCKCYELSIFL